MAHPSRRPTVAGMSTYVRQLTEIADRVWVVHHGWMELNVTVVAGERGLVVVDTLGSGPRPPGSSRTSAACRTPSAGWWRRSTPTSTGTTCLGNAALPGAWPGLDLHAHEEAAARPWRPASG